MRLVFATNNLHKLQELRDKIGTTVELLSLKDIGCNEELPETHDTLEGNALEKARYVADKFEVPCIADDTGLMIDALDGRPGVYSARYAGGHCSAEDNMQKVLRELEGEHNRKATFRTVIALIMKEKQLIFKGEVPGNITEEKTGHAGFGYDPIFIPEGYAISFAEMALAEKNKISHRARATEDLVQFLREAY